MKLKLCHSLFLVLYLKQRCLAINATYTVKKVSKNAVETVLANTISSFESFASYCNSFTLVNIFVTFKLFCYFCEIVKAAQRKYKCKRTTTLRKYCGIWFRGLEDLNIFKVACVVKIKLFYYGLILLWFDNTN